MTDGLTQESLVYYLLTSEPDQAPGELKQASINKKCHNHRPSWQRIPWHCEEETQDIDTHKTKVEKPDLSLYQRDDCKTRKGNKTTPQKQGPAYNKEGKDQESIQSSSTPDPGHHMGK